MDSGTIESELVRPAYSDALTELPNRKAFYEQSRRVLAHAERDREHFAVDGHRLYSSLSVGVAVCPDDGRLLRSPASG